MHEFLDTILNKKRNANLFKEIAKKSKLITDAINTVDIKNTIIRRNLEEEKVISKEKLENTKKVELNEDFKKDSIGNPKCINQYQEEKSISFLDCNLPLDMKNSHLDKDLNSSNNKSIGRYISSQRMSYRKISNIKPFILNKKTSIDLSRTLPSLMFNEKRVSFPNYPFQNKIPLNKSNKIRSYENFKKALHKPKLDLLIQEKELAQ
jgi:hypothetical protein